MISPLAKPSETRKILERFDALPKKRLGQNFLVNDDVVRKIIELADVQSDDVVVEVGPGIGTLTYPLLERAHRVIAIEKDAELPGILRETLADNWDQLSIVLKDALDVEAADLAFGRFGDDSIYANKLVSNLPYSVAATIVLDYFQKFGFIDSMTVMVQKEVGERMSAKPGSKIYGAYTVKLAMYAECTGSFLVGPSNFIPAPHVDSVVIRLDRKALDVEAEAIEAACTMADAAFFARRKTIANSCRMYFSGRGIKDAAFVNGILAEAGIDPSVRGETLLPPEYLELGKAYLNVR